MQILIIDDHALFRAGVRLLLTQTYPGIEVAEAGTLADGLDVALTRPLDLVFLDLNLPDADGLDGLVTLYERRPSLPVIVVSADESATTIHRALELHAMGFVPKSQKPDVLLAAFHSALAGGMFLPASVIDAAGNRIPFDHGFQQTAARVEANECPCVSECSDFGITPREFETLRWLLRGLPTKAIASRMGLEDITVRKYVSQLLAHFNVRRRTELIVLMAESGKKLGQPALSDPVGDRCSLTS
jgi:DNA-binding NarL/FixJ family response regulator